MADRDAAFVGSIPENYDRYLGPLLFHGYGDEMAARLPVGRGMRVLETACGTGIVTERLLARLAGGALRRGRPKALASTDRERERTSRCVSDRAEPATQRRSGSARRKWRAPRRIAGGTMRSREAPRSG